MENNMAASFPAPTAPGADVMIIIEVRMGQNDFLHGIILRRIAELCGLSSRLEFVLVEEADTALDEPNDKLQYVVWDTLLLLIGPEADESRIACFKKNANLDVGFKEYARRFKDLFQPSTKALRKKLIADWNEFFDRVRQKPLAADFQEYIDGLATRYESIVAKRIPTLK
jgi:hypothetical protein